MQVVLQYNTWMTSCLSSSYHFAAQSKKKLWPIRKEQQKKTVVLASRETRKRVGGERVREEVRGWVAWVTAVANGKTTNLRLAFVHFHVHDNNIFLLAVLILFLLFVVHLNITLVLIAHLCRLDYRPVRVCFSECQCESACARAWPRLKNAKKMPLHEG